MKRKTKIIIDNVKNTIHTAMDDISKLLLIDGIDINDSSFVLDDICALVYYNSRDHIENITPVKLKDLIDRMSGIDDVVTQDDLCYYLISMFAEGLPLLGATLDYCVILDEYEIINPVYEVAQRRGGQAVLYISILMSTLFMEYCIGYSLYGFRTKHLLLSIGNYVTLFGMVGLAGLLLALTLNTKDTDLITSAMRVSLVGEVGLVIGNLVIRPNESNMKVLVESLEDTAQSMIKVVSNVMDLALSNITDEWWDGHIVFKRAIYPVLSNTFDILDVLCKYMVPHYDGRYDASTLSE